MELLVETAKQPITLHCFEQDVVEDVLDTLSMLTQVPTRNLGLLVRSGPHAGKLMEVGHSLHSYELGVNPKIFMRIKLQGGAGASKVRKLYYDVTAEDTNQGLMRRWTEKYQAVRTMKASATQTSEVRSQLLEVEELKKHNPERPHAYFFLNSLTIPQLKMLQNQFSPENKRGKTLEQRLKTLLPYLMKADMDSVKEEIQFMEDSMHLAATTWLKSSYLTNEAFNFKLLVDDIKQCIENKLLEMAREQGRREGLLATQMAEHHTMSPAAGSSDPTQVKPAEAVPMQVEKP